MCPDFEDTKLYTSKLQLAANEQGSFEVNVCSRVPKMIRNTPKNCVGFSLHEVFHKPNSGPNLGWWCKSWHIKTELVYMHKFIEFDRAPCRKGFQHLTDFGWGGIPVCICAGVHDCLHTHTRKTFSLHCFSHLSLSLALSLSLNCSCVSSSCMAGSVWHPQAITCFCKLIISQASFPL